MTLRCMKHYFLHHQTDHYMFTLHDVTPSRYPFPPYLLSIYLHNHDDCLVRVSATL